MDLRNKRNTQCSCLTLAFKTGIKVPQTHSFLNGVDAGNARPIP